MVRKGAPTNIINQTKTIKIMRHSFFNTTISAIRQVEFTEFMDALEAHGGKYEFVSQEWIDNGDEGSEGEYFTDSEHVPHVYFSRQGASELVVVRAELRESKIDGHRYAVVYGQEYYTGNDLELDMYELGLGDFHHMMDFMSEPAQ